MKAEYFNFESTDGKEIFASKWTMENEVQPKAVIQISHTY